MQSNQPIDSIEPIKNVIMVKCCKLCEHKRAYLIILIICVDALHHNENITVMSGHFLGFTVLVKPRECPDMTEFFFDEY